MSKKNEEFTFKETDADFKVVIDKINHNEKLTDDEYMLLIAHMPFCVRLTRLRDKRGLTIEEAAYMMSVPVELFQLWEDGVKLPDFSNFVCLAKLLDVSLEYLQGAHATFVEDNIDKLN